MRPASLRTLYGFVIELTGLRLCRAYLDRGNIGNARLQGLQATLLDGSDNKYDIVLTAYVLL